MKRIRPPMKTSRQFPCGRSGRSIRHSRKNPEYPSNLAAPKPGNLWIFPEYAECLQDNGRILPYTFDVVFHEFVEEYFARQTLLDDQLHGLFATRNPYRPNRIGLSVVRLIARQNNNLEFEGVETLDGTPLLDIKPYVPEFDIRTNTRNGWYDSRKRAPSTGIFLAKFSFSRVSPAAWNLSAGWL